jgi:hypothetical protein
MLHPSNWRYESSKVITRVWRSELVGLKKYVPWRATQETPGRFSSGNKVKGIVKGQFGGFIWEGLLPGIKPCQLNPVLRLT